VSEGRGDLDSLRRNVMTSSGTITLMDFRHGKVVEIDEDIPPLGVPAEQDAEATGPSAETGAVGVVFGSIGSPPNNERG
jgi:hypothetical protein